MIFIELHAGPSDTKTAYPFWIEYSGHPSAVKSRPPGAQDPGSLQESKRSFENTKGVKLSVIIEFK